MKRLSVYKSKITYQICDDRIIDNIIIEAGEQLFKDETTYIKELDSSNLNANICEWICPSEYEKNEVFGFMRSCTDTCNNLGFVATVVIEETRIYKVLEADRRERDKYYTVSYNIVRLENHKSIANAFMVFSKLNNCSLASLKSRLLDEIAWSQNVLVDEMAIKEQWYFSSQAAGFFFHECIGHLLEEEQFSISDYKLGDVIFNAPINVIENYNLGNLKDDFGYKVLRNMRLIKKGKIVGNLTAKSEPYSGNAYTQEPFVEPLARMNVMYVDSDKPVSNIISSIEDGLYIREICSGEYNPINGEIGLVVAKASNIKKGVCLNHYKQFNLIFNISDLLYADVELSNNHVTISSLCGKRGATKKVTYIVPEMKIDWRRNGKPFTNRYF